jgi:uncharacterized protein GlcG (DUF336 family)
MMTLTLATATKIALAALDAAAKENIGVSVVVTDVGGVIRVAMRADNVGPFVMQAAIGKAKTSIGFNSRSSRMAQFFGANPAGTAGLVGVTGGQFLPIGGGVLIHDKDGVLLGACACAGSAPENDERFAIAGVTSADLVVPG